MEVSGQLHAPAALPPGKEPWYPLGRRLYGPQSRFGRGGEEKNSQPLPGLEPPNHPARSTAPKLNFLTTFNAAPPQTKLTINSIVQSPFKEADIRLAGQEISHLLWKSVYQCS
jgi:hypothetical protein